MVDTSCNYIEGGKSVKAVVCSIPWFTGGLNSKLHVMCQKGKLTWTAYFCELEIKFHVVFNPPVNYVWIMNMLFLPALPSLSVGLWVSEVAHVQYVPH